MVSANRVSAAHANTVQTSKEQARTQKRRVRFDLASSRSMSASRGRSARSTRKRLRIAARGKSRPTATPRAIRKRAQRAFLRAVRPERAKSQTPLVQSSGMSTKKASQAVRSSATLPLRLVVVKPNDLRFCCRACGGSAQSLSINHTSRRADTLRSVSSKRGLDCN